MIITDEQIKQNAKNYVDSLRDDRDMGKYDYNDMEKSYIKGAHSRDEEIKELDQLRNPWISVKDKLSEKIKNKEVSKKVYATWPDGTLGEVYYNYE